MHLKTSFAKWRPVCPRWCGGWGWGWGCGWWWGCGWGVNDHDIWISAFTSKNCSIPWCLWSEYKSLMDLSYFITGVPKCKLSLVNYQQYFSILGLKLNYVVRTTNMIWDILLFVSSVTGLCHLECWLDSPCSQFTVRKILDGMTLAPWILSLQPNSSHVFSTRTYQEALPMV